MRSSSEKFAIASRSVSELCRWYRASSDDSSIYFYRAGRPLDDRTLRSGELWVMSAQGKDPRRLATLEPQSSLATYLDVSVRDEIVWVQFRRGKEELWLAQLPGGF